MKSLAAFFVDRPLMTNLLVIGFFIFGLSTLKNIQKEGFPEVTLNTVKIQAVYPGASALDVETSVTIPIEEALESVSGVSDTSSTSRENLSVVTVEVDDNVGEDEFEKIFDDIRQTLDGVDDLPSGLDGKPTLKRFSSTDLPIIEIGISGSYESLREFVPTLEKSLRRLSDVAQVNRLGLPDEEVQIQVDLNEAKRLHIDLRTISKSIQMRNLEGTAGTIESYDAEKNVIIHNKISRPEEVLETIVRMSPDGRGVKLGQIASVQHVAKDNNLIVKTNGKRGAALQVVKKSSADIINTIDKIENLIATISVPDDVEISLLNDRSAFTRSRLKLLGTNAFIGFILVTVILYIFFGFNTAAWTAFGIPFSLLGAVIMLPSLGATFNALSIGGFVLVLGLLVDDAIVVSEQINRMKEQGLSARDAAVAGVVRIWKPVLAGAVTTVVAFSPLTQLGGLPGKFIWIIPLVVMVALVFSLFESFFVLPVHLSHAKIKKATKHGLMQKFEKLYRRSLRHVLKWRYAVLPAFLMVFIVAIVGAAKFLDKEVFPQEGIESFSIQLDMPAGSSLERTAEEIAKIEKVLLDIPKGELIGIAARVGSKNHKLSADQGTLTNAAVATAYLVSFADRKRGAHEIVKKIRGPIEEVLSSGAIYRVEFARMGPPIANAFEVEVASNDEQIRLQKVKEIKAFLATVDGVQDIGDDIVPGKNEVKLIIDEKQLAQTGISISDVLMTFRLAFDGLIVTNTVVEGESTDYRLRLSGDARKSLDTISNIPIMNPRGRMIKLGQIVSYEESSSIGEQSHLNGERTSVVFGDLDKTKMNPKQINKILSEKFQSSDQFVINVGGESEDNQEIFGGLASAALLAMLGVWLVISIILNSMIKPLIVMSVVPFGIVGIILALFLHGMSISMFAMISLIGLTGIVVNGSILMLYTIDSEESDDFRTRVINGASSRLRPIVLTTITTISGLLPTAYGIGGSDPFISPMCLTMTFGIMVATSVLLFLIPSLYAVINDISKIAQKAFGRLNMKKAASTGLLIVLLFSAQGSDALAQTKVFSLSETRTLVESHPLLEKANESVKQEGLKSDALEGRFDSKFEVTPMYKYSESEPDVFGGFTGEEKQTVTSGKMSVSKMLPGGVILNSGLTATQLEMEPGELSPFASMTPAGAMSNAGMLPDTIERKMVNIEGNLIVPLWDNLGNRQYKMQKKMANSMHSAQSRARDINKNALEFAIIRAYWQAVINKSAYKNAETSYKRAVAIHKSNKTKHRLGTISDSEILLSQINLFKKEDNLTKARMQWDQSLIALNKSIPGQHFVDVRVQNSNIQYSLPKAAKKLSFKSNPSLAMLSAQEEATSQQLALLNSQARDSINLMLSVSSLGQDDEFGEASDKALEFDKPTYMAGITWKFQPSKSTNRAERYIAGSRKNQIALERKNKISDLRRAADDMNSKVKMYNQLLTNLTRTKSKLAALVKEQAKEYGRGQITTKDYLEGQDMADSTSIQEISLKASKHLAIAGYLMQVGELERYYALASSQKNK